MTEVTELDLKLMKANKWVYRFLDLARHISTWSKDPSTQCGAVIVRPDKTVASVGFNGFPRGVTDRSDLLENREEKYKRVVHAEVNAVLHCAARPVGCTLYTWPPGVGPTCERCATVVIQSGISQVIYVRDDTDFAQRWAESCRVGLEMYRQAGVDIYPVRREIFNAYRAEQIANGN